MLRYFITRIAYSLITLAAVVVAIFFIFQVLGDPVRGILPINATDEQVEEYRKASGLADPWPVRLERYLAGVVRLDFGQSRTRGGPALAAVLEALPRTLILAFASITIVVLAGLALGIPAGFHAGDRIDRLIQSVCSILFSIPEFWSGLVLIVIFAVHLAWFPTGGTGGLRFLVLPAVAMSLPPIGRFALVVRESVRSVLAEPFILVARSKGLPGRVLVLRHVLRAALVPIIAIGGLELTRMAIGGVVVIESVFSWPGLGRLYVDAMSHFDLPLISATLFCSTLVVLAANLVIDFIYLWVDPRVALAA